jgi:hypothetical protein
VIGGFKEETGHFSIWGDYAYFCLLSTQFSSATRAFVEVDILISTKRYLAVGAYDHEVIAT